MRTIKFKAKSKLDGLWYVGDLIHAGEDEFIKPESERNSLFPQCKKAIPGTVCQFTGFLDKNGKEIYEGDVLQSDLPPFSIQNRSDSFSDVRYGVVVFNSGLGSFHLKVYSNRQYKTDYYFESVPYGFTVQNCKDFEVVGSVHDEEWQEKLNLKDE